jgi:hypothetical protein
MAFFSGMITCIILYKLFSYEMVVFVVSYAHLVSLSLYIDYFICEMREGLIVSFLLLICENNLI